MYKDVLPISKSHTLLPSSFIFSKQSVPLLSRRIFPYMFRAMRCHASNVLIYQILYVKSTHLILCTTKLCCAMCSPPIQRKLVILEWTMKMEREKRRTEKKDKNGKHASMA